MKAPLPDGYKHYHWQFRSATTLKTLRALLMKHQSNTESFDPHDKQKTMRTWIVSSNGSLPIRHLNPGQRTCWLVCQQGWLPMSVWTVTVHWVWHQFPRRHDRQNICRCETAAEETSQISCLYKQLHEDLRRRDGRSPTADAKSHPFNSGLNHRLSYIHEVWACAPSTISLWLSTRRWDDPQGLD